MCVGRIGGRVCIVCIVCIVWYVGGIALVHPVPCLPLEEVEVACVRLV